MKGSLFKEMMAILGRFLVSGVGACGGNELNMSCFLHRKLLKETEALPERGFLTACWNVLGIDLEFPAWI